MRIIAGNFKGKKIHEPKDKVTRPLKDLTKESIFNIIKHSNLFDIELEESDILDVFAGVGSFGLECLSRGSRSVIFFENYINVLPILKKNISNLNYQNKTKIIQKSIFDHEVLNFLNTKFNIIFMDPPYKEKNFSKILEKMITLDLLKKNGIFIIHRHKKENDKFPIKFEILKETSYGISKIIFAKKI